MTSLASLEGDVAPMSETQRLLLAQLRARVGSVICSKWRLDALLGLGGMAAVYSATHRNGHGCAIKMLLPSFASSPEVIKRFLKEGYLANEVKHPGVVTVLDDDVTADGAYFLVMELLEGESFDRVLRKHPDGLEPTEAARVGYDVLDVLAAAHDRGIVHRDIKPENVFLLSDGRVKVLDFGIAGVRHAQSQHGGTLHGSVMGTPGFMPPEQARGHWDEVDAQSDVWALGATMFVALTGRPLRVAPTTNEELLQAMTMPAPPLQSIKADLPLSLADTVDRALAFDKRVRWRDARQMQGAFRAELGDYAPTLHAAPSSLAQPRPDLEGLGVSESLGTRDAAVAVVRAPTEALLSTTRSHVLQDDVVPAGVPKSSRLGRTALLSAVAATVLLAAGIVLFSMQGRSGAGGPVGSSSESMPAAPPTELDPFPPSASALIVLDALGAQPGEASATSDAQSSLSPASRKPVAIDTRPPSAIVDASAPTAATAAPVTAAAAATKGNAPPKPQPTPSFDPLYQRR